MIVELRSKLGLISSSVNQDSFYFSVLSLLLFFKSAFNGQLPVIKWTTVEAWCFFQLYVYLVFSSMNFLADSFQSCSLCSFNNGNHF
jgi:Ca2+/Na+ antiporter